MANVDIAAIRGDWVGRGFQEFDLVVDRERMLEFAISGGETDLRFVDPGDPDFQASTGFPTHINVARMLPDDFPQIGNGGIDGGKSIEWFQPMRAGDALHAEGQIADIYEKTGRSGTLVFIVNRMTFKDADGAPVATVDWCMIRQS